MLRQPLSPGDGLVQRGPACRRCRRTILARPALSSLNFFGWGPDRSNEILELERALERSRAETGEALRRAAAAKLALEDALDAQNSLRDDVASYAARLKVADK